ncbi:MULTISPECIES: right-handed parallel beta-helix repeat-containing protein [unclassified Sphingobacterium]|uniref:right-handed parallel beta-helix repeat-containing protein n=1 Tax=unclassified Sphingobacterium TaxID=2609468 RepID=UPI0025E5FB7C|nr:MULTISPECIES: right-handed parallel beta-helix repeat-containing protein [unclassified Sphingobacterium]
MKIFALLIVVFSSICGACSQPVFRYSTNLQPKKVSVSTEIQGRQFVEIVNYLPPNHVKDGSVDYTNFIQKAISENSYVKMPNFPIQINDNGIHLSNNSIIVFNEKSKLYLKPSRKQQFAMLKIENKKNVTLINPVLEGDRKKHLGSGGEWGMGISILSSSNVKILNPSIRNCWGDGIYINRLSGNKNSDNIIINGGMMDFNRRNGISIISGSNIYIKNILLSNQSGTLPMAGLAIEPNNSNDILKGIHLDNIVTHNNNESGIGIVLVKLIGNSLKTVSIDVNNHIDNGSKNSVLISGLKSKYQSQIKKIGGNISFNSCVWNGKSNAARIGSNFNYMPTLTISKVRSTDKKLPQLKRDLKARRISVIN